MQLGKYACYCNKQLLLHTNKRWLFRNNNRPSIKFRTCRTLVDQGRRLRDG